MQRKIEDIVDMHASEDPGVMTHCIIVKLIIASNSGFGVTPGHCHCHNGCKGSCQCRCGESHDGVESRATTTSASTLGSVSFLVKV